MCVCVFVYVEWVVGWLVSGLWVDLLEQGIEEERRRARERERLSRGRSCGTDSTEPHSPAQPSSAPHSVATSSVPDGVGGPSDEEGAVVLLRQPTRRLRA
jgi:hypothetical protein